jgi:hypothetical protein
MSRPIEDVFVDTARQVEELLDQDFLAFQSVLRGCSELTVDEYCAVTGGFLAHYEAKRREFAQAFHAALHAHDARKVEDITAHEAAVLLLTIIRNEGGSVELIDDGEDFFLQCDLDGVRDFKGKDPQMLLSAVFDLRSEIIDVLRRAHGALTRQCEGSDFSCGSWR